MRVRRSMIFLSLLFFVFSTVSLTLAQKAADAPAAKEAVLKAPEVGDKIFPDKVFFRGQSASVQARNTGGVRFADDAMCLAGLVDASGYSSGLKEKYQGYLLTEVPLVIGGQTLKPGAYGFGFLEGDKVVVMDLGAHDVLQTSSTKDSEMKRPVPLQVTTGSAAGKYRLYKGRDYVEFQRGN